MGTTYWLMVSRSDNSIAQGCSGCNVANVCITSTTPSVLPINPCNSCSSPCSLTTNVTLNSYNGNATADAFICSGSVENNVWYQWCAPSNWPAGQQAYISVFDQFCGSTSGLQLTVWNIGATCPTASTNSNFVCQSPGSVTSYYYQWTAVANTCYRIVIDGFSGTICNYNITVGSLIVLPIELLSFDAVPKGSKEVNVSWSTATEENNDYFTIERTIDGINFEVLGVVASQAVNGNSSSVLNYSKVDSKPYRGTSYYRLKQTDYDGNFSYSALKTVKIDEFADLNFIVYPNPTGENENAYLQFSGNADDEVQISIVDVTGKLVSQKGIVLSNSGNTTIELKHNFSSGMYFINATSKSGASYNQKLMVK